MRHWWPVAGWIGVIFLESTDYGSARNTFGLLYLTLRYLHIKVDYSVLEEFNHVLRKSGHFLGYATLSILAFFAFRNTYRDRLRPLLKRPWKSYFRDLWQIEWSLVAMLLTVVTASADEFHQTFLPSRTGRWQDVLLDSTGALVAQGCIYLFSLWSFRRQPPHLVNSELTLTR